MCNEFRKTEIFDAGYKHSCICIHEIDKEREAKTVILYLSLNQIVIQLVKIEKMMPTNSIFSYRPLEIMLRSIKQP